MKTIIDLRSELDRAYEQYDLAKYIDSTARMIQEQAYWSDRIAALKKEIAELEADE